MARIFAGAGFSLVSYIGWFVSREAGEAYRYEVGQRGDEVLLSQLAARGAGPLGPDMRFVLRGNDLQAGADITWTGTVTGFDVLLWDAANGIYKRMASADGVNIRAGLFQNMLRDDGAALKRTLAAQIDTVIGTSGADTLDSFSVDLPTLDRIALRGGDDLLALHVNTTDGMEIDAGLGQDRFNHVSGGARITIDAAAGTLTTDGGSTSPRQIAISGFEIWEIAARSLDFRGWGGDESVQSMGRGNDTLWGRGGDDTLDALFGNDTIYGGAGNDVLIDSDSNGQGLLDGGAGQDTIYAPGATTMVDLQRGLLETWGGFRKTLVGIENVICSGTDDTVQGSDVANIFWGEGGRDLLRGGGGDDRLFGGTRSDRLFGGLGDDTLVGGKAGDFLHAGTGDTLVFRGFDDNDFIISDGEGLTLVFGPRTGLDSMAEVRAALTASADGARLTHSEGFASVTFHGMTPADVQASDFVFAWL